MFGQHPSYFALMPVYSAVLIIERLPYLVNDQLPYKCIPGMGIEILEITEHFSKPLYNPFNKTLTLPQGNDLPQHGIASLYSIDSDPKFQVDCPFTGLVSARLS